MKRALLSVLVLSAPVAGSLSLIVTPADELRSAQLCYGEGTNLIARGMFREAEDWIKRGTATATGRLRELESRTGTVGPLRDFVDRIQALRDRFDEDWTNAALSHLALRDPIKAYVETNAVLKGPLDWPLRSFDWIATEVAEGKKVDAGVEMRNFQGALQGEINACETLRGLEADFRAVLADLERARDKLKVERDKPLDAERALGIAREYVAGARAKVDAPGSQFVGADWDFTCAERYLKDVRGTGAAKEGVVEVEAALAETKRAWSIAGVRYYLQEARDWLAKDRPDNAKGSINIAETCYLSRLKGNPEFERLSELVGKLKESAERMIADDERARKLAAIAECREKLGDPNAPVLPAVLLSPAGGSGEEIRRFAAETDFAAILHQEFSETNLDLCVYRREGAWISFRDDPDFEPTIRAAMLRAVNTNYPATFPKGERVSIVLQTTAWSQVFARTRTVDGRAVKEVVPYQRLLHLIQSSEQPDDLFLYFPDAAEDLFVPNGRTALVPGLGAYLEKKLPKSWADPKPITFKGEAFKPVRH